MSTAFINVAYSPRGEGKTTGGLFSTIYHALHLTGVEFWPMRWAIVRDTRRNIGISTARTIKEWFPPPLTHWRGKEDEPETITLYIDGMAAVVYDCFGVDTPADLSRFQSYEASGGVWIEEPAPAATNSEFISSGISETVLAVAITSVRGARNPRIQLSFNPPPATHWTAQLWHLPGYLEPGSIEEDMPQLQREAREEIRKMSRVFLLPPGSNKALDTKTPGYRERNRIALMATGRTDLVARLVEGRVGYAKIGESVTPGFSGSHIVPETNVLPERPFFIAYDYGLQPAAIVAQLTASGHLHIHFACALENQGMEQLITKRLQPWLMTHPEVRKYIHIGGHEAAQRDQSNSEHSALKSTIRLLGGTFVRGAVAWSARREALHEGLARYVGAIPWVRISQAEASLLIRCLDGAWYYPTDMAGNVMRDLPSKEGIMPSLGDAFAHLVEVLLRGARKPGAHTNPFGSTEKRYPRLPQVNPYSHNPIPSRTRL